MITEDYVSFETAKLLKEKGFDDVCHAFYDKDGIFINLLQFVGNSNLKGVNDEKITFAPTLQMAMKWLRESNNLYVDIILHSVNRTLIYEARIDKINSPSDIDVIIPQINEPIYENSCEAAIKYCLENLI